MEISKRDYFAAHALSGLLAKLGNAPESHHATDALAVQAFHFADAMLKHSKTLMDPVEIDPNHLRADLHSSERNEDRIV